jgi:diaminohydroxyphosphoribosylaminopyrimidine deaminase / 5-amino-6-(5-phosphoribosylamino)uracil reductase
MHSKYMKKAIELAKEGTGHTSPNPLVGAVVVKNSEIVGTGYHRKCGGPHAESFAVEAAGHLSKGADLYVNLEPCSHVGRTPPCTEAIINAGIKKVFVAIKDPNPLVNGKGIEKLRSSGVEVNEGLLEDEALKINEVFLKYIRTKKPFIALKTAMSIDGKIATETGESRWITGQDARLHGHMLRNTYDAILVGIGTQKKDNPQLTCRLTDRECRNPIRIIVDSRLSIDENARVFDVDDSALTIIATTGQASSSGLRQIRKKARAIVVNEDGRVDLPRLLEMLGEMEITSILIEGGSKINGSFLESNLIDKFYCYVAPIVIGGKGAPGAFEEAGTRTLNGAARLEDVSADRLGEDLLLTGYFSNSR